MKKKRCKGGKGKVYKQVLFVAYSFPPVGGAGVQRPAKFVKYLRHFGWNPSVLTCANPSVPVVDEELLSDIPEDIDIFKAKTFEPSYAKKTAFSGKETANILKESILSRIKKVVKDFGKAILLPDIQVLWWPCLSVRLFRLLRTTNFDCVFVTAPPYSSMMPVVFICNLMKIPVVSDFRDEWIFNRQHIENSSQGRFTQFVDRVSEKYVVSRSNAIVTATNFYVQGLRERHPHVDSGKMYTITNGYDEEDFQNVTRSDKEKKLINIVYSGTVWSATSLKCFVAALKMLFDDRPDYKPLVNVHVFGRVVPEEKNYLTSKDILGNIFLRGYCSHDVILQEICNADILLLTLSAYDGAERIIPAKTFEYMATGNHILALVPSGETQCVLLDSDVPCTFFRPDDIDLIKNYLCTLVDNLQAGRAIGGNKQRTIMPPIQYSRKLLTGKLATVFNDVKSL